MRRLEWIANQEVPSLCQPLKRARNDYYCVQDALNIDHCDPVVGKYVLRRHWAIIIQSMHKHFWIEGSTLKFIRYTAHLKLLMRSPMATESTRYTVGGTHRWQTNWLLHFVWEEILADWNVHDDHDEATECQHDEWTDRNDRSNRRDAESCCRKVDYAESHK